MPVDGLPPIAPRVPAEWLQAPEVAPVDPRHAARFQQPSRVRNLEPELRELGLERDGSRFDRPEVVALAQEEGLLAENQLQPFPLDCGAMLGVEVSKSSAVRTRQDRAPVARSGAHAVVQQRLVENDPAETVVDRRSPEIQQLEGRQAFVESAHGLPQPSPEHRRCVGHATRRHGVHE